MTNQIENKAYYYTSFGVLYNIVTSRELWLNSIWSMADYTEIRYFIKAVQKHLEVSRPTYSTQIKTFFKTVAKALDKTDFFAMSMTKARDDVAMWERFAKSGKGVCLVFDLNRLMQFAENNGLIINELSYPTDIEQLGHSQIIRQWITDKELSGFANEESLVENFIMTSVFHKDPAFRSEKEIRMSTCWTPKFSNHIQYKLVSEMVRKAYILKECAPNNVHKESDIRGDQTIADLLCEVIIGPTSRQSERELRDFLNEHQFSNTAVSKSTCPL